MPEDTRQTAPMPAATRRQTQRVIWRPLAALLALGTACTALAGEAAAQSNKWNEYFEGKCFEQDADFIQNRHEIIFSEKTILIPHRGIFSVPVPKKVEGDDMYAAENTLAAFQYAQCMGFIAVELDLRTTKDGVALLSHETVMGRVNSVDALGGSYDPTVSGAVKIGDVKIRDGDSPMTRISDLTWAEIRPLYSFDKTYDTWGSRSHDIGAGTPDSLKLKWLFDHAQDPSLHVNKLHFVLDVQNHDTYLSTLQAMEGHPGARATYKMWTEAIPFVTPPWGGLNPQFSAEISSLAIAINPFNTKICEWTPSGNSDTSNDPFNCNIIQSITVAAPGKQYRLYSKYFDISDQAIKWMHTDRLRALISNNTNSNGISWAGEEVLLPDSSGTLLYNALNTIRSTPPAPADYDEQKWGVVRKYDYVSDTCNTEYNYLDQATYCTNHIPNGLPVEGQVSPDDHNHVIHNRTQGYFITTTDADAQGRENIMYNGLDEGVVKERQRRGRTGSRQVYDIRELSEARRFGDKYIRDHPHHRAAMVSAFVPLIE